jgi:hypothetical protein
MAIAPLLRVALVAFVVVWLFGPSILREVVPLWLPFLVALGLEVQFFLAAAQSPAYRASPPDRRPQAIDQERFGYAIDGEEEDDEPDEWDSEPVVWRPAAQRRRWPWRGLAAGLAVIGALAVLAVVVESRSGWRGLSDAQQAEATARFSAEASRIAGHDVEIRCDESGERVGFVQHTDGVAEVGGRIAYLAPDRCHELYRLAFEGATTGGTGRGIDVLAHEAWHLRGVRNEAETECYALQSGVELGERLGLSAERAQQLMRRALAENQGGGTNLEYRVGPDCRDGGRLDLDPARATFP